jgi:hypothetical protein
VLCVLLVVAGAGYYFLAPGPEARPAVLISAPDYGEQIEVGRPVTFHAVARAETKITRVELWVGDRLHDARESSLPGGTSPFPLAVRWAPPAAGSYTLTARAFDGRGARSQASVNVEAVDRPDLDGDRVPDESDECPEEPGAPGGAGCLTPVEGDRDGDGVPDEADECADEIGLPWAGGCPTPGDTDADGIPDEEDACAGLRGLVEHDGCPDSDGDGIPDGGDSCPDAPGPSGSDGCPDSDGDGVPDWWDICDDEPGVGAAVGCPDTGAGDADGDGVPDDVDLDADEPGLPEHGGCPVPGEGEDGDGDGIPDAEELPDDPLLDLAGPWIGEPRFPRAKALVAVEVQVLEFAVHEDYQEVYCYASLASLAFPRDAPGRSESFEPLPEERHWSFQFPNGTDSWLVGIDEEDTLVMRLECWGGILLEPYYLGDLTVLHPPSDWNSGEHFTATSRDGDEGHSFDVTYRICSPGCDPGVLNAPILVPVYARADNLPVLYWAWDGNEEEIDGFNVYVNGSLAAPVPKGDRHAQWFEGPACGETWVFQVSAYAGHAPRSPIRESPLSNEQSLVGGRGEPCRRIVRVTFRELRTWLLPEDDDSSADLVGPIDGFLRANDASLMSQFEWASHVWFGWGTWGGWFIADAREYEIADWVAHMRLDPDHYPERFFTNYVTVELGPDEDLEVWAQINDCDGYWDRWGYQTLFDGRRTWSGDEIASGEYVILGPRRYMDLTVELEVLPYYGP